MKTVFENYLRNQTDLSEADITLISKLGVPRKMRRHELLLTCGDVCKHKTFITKGLLKTYTVKEDGSEHILQFSPELTWTLDAESYDGQSPSRYFIDTIEDSDVILWSKPDFDYLLAELPLLKLYSERIISRAVHQSRHRIITSLSGTPEEKYDDFVQTSPGLLSRLPLRMIAAYLGISLKTLTRLRSAQLQK